MAEVLSQNEIDALLTAVTDGQVAAVAQNNPSVASEEATKEYALYDLTSQDKIIRGRLVALKGIHERFASLFRMTLNQKLKKTVTVKVQNTEFVKFSDYQSNLNAPLNLALFETEELRGTMVLVSKSSFAYTLVDAYYGGADRPYAKAGEREAFTSIENEIIRKFVGLASKDLEQAWKLNYLLKLKYQRAESNPFFVGAIQPNDSVAVVSCEVEVESLKGSFDLVVQLHPLDSISHCLSVNITGQIPGEEETWKEHWLKELMDMDFEVRGLLGQTEKSLKEIRRMKVGDVLVLNQDATSPIPLLIQDVSKCRGMIGVLRGNNAVRLTKDLSIETEESKDGK
jgi:flagellar motor switch protein FliM